MTLTITSAKSILQALRYHIDGVSLHPCIEVMRVGNQNGNALRATTTLPKGTTIAVVPYSCILTTKRVVDADSLGFSSHSDFLEGKQPIAVLAHHVSLQYWLGNSWYKYQLPCFHEEAAAPQLYAQFKSQFVTPPETWFSKALMYVKSAAVGDGENLALIPVVDLITKRNVGNVWLDFEFSPTTCVGYSSLIRLKNHRKTNSKAESEKFICLATSRDVEPLETFTLPSNTTLPSSVR